MNNFKLDDSIEYRQIKSIYGIIENVFSSGDNGFIAGASRSFQLIVSQIGLEVEAISKLSVLSNESSLLRDRKAFITALTGQQAIESLCKEFNLKLSKNLNNVCSIANYSYAKRILWHDLEFNDEFKPYSAGEPAETAEMKVGRHSRKKAEEYFKSGNIENAYITFLNTEEKHYGDFLCCYQLGLICFFEKGDHERALNYFTLAAKYSQSKLKKIFVHSTLFCALIYRLMAAGGVPESYPQAAAAAKQAYEADPENPSAIYGYAQSLACSPSYISLVQQIRSLLMDLVEKNDVFMIQMIYDRALDNLSSEMSTLYNGIYNEAKIDVKEAAADLEDQLQRMTADASYSEMASKIDAIKTESSELAAGIESDSSYFQFIALRQKAQKLKDGLQAIIKEVTDNKNFAEFKSFLEKIALQYNEELNNEVLKFFTSAQNDFDKKIEALIQMNKVYPALETETFLRNYKRTSLGEGDRLPAKDWRNQRIYSLVKAVSGCFVFMTIFTALFGIWLFYYNEIAIFFKTLMVLNLILWPLYATACGKFYYGFIEGSRRELMEEIKKLDAFIFANEKKKRELIAETKKKYVKMIMERKKITQTVAEQILELCMEDKFDKVRALVF